MSRARRPTPLYVAAIPFFDLRVTYSADEPVPSECEHAAHSSGDETLDFRSGVRRPSLLDASIGEHCDAQPGVTSPVSEGEPGCAGGPGQAPCEGA